MTTQELAQKLAQFESTHEKPETMRACLDFCKEQLSDLNLIVKEYEHEGVPSVVFQTHEGTDFDVMLLGHIDTVPGKPKLFEGTITDGKLYGRGTLDMKAFVATSLQVLRRVVEEGTSLRIAAMIVSDEELGGVHGARYLVEDIGYKADTVLVPDDGEDIQKVVVESKHIFQFHFEAAGRESQACRPWQGDNAIEKLIRTFGRLKEHFPIQERKPEDIWVNTISLGIIEGGTASNEVPEHASMSVDVRLTPSVSREQLMQWVEAALEDGVTYEVTLEGFPTIVDPNDPIVARYLSLIESVTGKPSTQGKHGGGTDGRYFAQAGMRTIVHQGSGAFCQSDDEHVVLETLDQLVEIQSQFILGYANA